MSADILDLLDAIINAAGAAKVIVADRVADKRASIPAEDIIRKRTDDFANVILARISALNAKLDEIEAQRLPEPPVIAARREAQARKTAPREAS